MLMMRLQRVGRKNDPSYRIVVTDKRTGPKSNKHVAIIGSYSPKLNSIVVKSDEAKKWLAQGVKPSDTVHNLLVSEKIIDGKKVNVLPKKSPIIDEKALAEAEAAKAAEEVQAKEVAETEAESEKEEETTSDTEEAEATKAE